MSHLPKLSFSRVHSRIEKALLLLYKNDHFLITNCTAERSITHKLAEYIQQFFPEWNVDCEYNRRGENRPKAIPSQETSYPDIIIHHRNTKHNLLIIEAKSIHSRKHDSVQDKEKIKAYVEDPDYQYRFGLWILFYDDLAQTRLDWFENHNGSCQEADL